MIQWNDQVINFQNTQRLAQDYKFTYLFPLISKATKLPSKLKQYGSSTLYDQSNFNHGEVDLNIVNSKEFYNYLNQCWVYSLVVVANDERSNKGKEMQETLDDIIFLIEEEME